MPFTAWPWTASTVEHRTDNGRVQGKQTRVIDFDDPANNDWLAINQFTVVENKHERRPDVVLFVNGLPLAIIELKNPTDEKATIWSAFQQLQTYKAEIPSLFAFNAALIVSDGLEARIGTLTAGREWFKPWRTISGRGASRSTPAAIASDAGRRLHTASFPGTHPRLPRVRGRWQRHAH